MKVDNRHQRVVAGRRSRVVALVGDFDAIWPTQISSAPRSSDGRLFTAGPMLWEAIDRPGAARAFKVVEPEWLQVDHWFELEAVDGGTLLRHVLAGHIPTEHELTWRRRVEPFHNRVLEALLDNVEAAVGRESATARRQGGERWRS